LSRGENPYSPICIYFL